MTLRSILNGSFLGAFGERRTFPCPYCQKEVGVQKGRQEGAYRLLHVDGQCKVAASLKVPKQHYNAALLSSFDSYCKPKRIFERLEGLDENGDIIRK